MVSGATGSCRWSLTIGLFLAVGHWCHLPAPVNRCHWRSLSLPVSVADRWKSLSPVTVVRDSCYSRCCCQSHLVVNIAYTEYAHNSHYWLLHLIAARASISSKGNFVLQNDQIDDITLSVAQAVYPVFAWTSTGSLNITLNVDLEPSEVTMESFEPHVWPVSVCIIYIHHQNIHKTEIHKFFRILQTPTCKLTKTSVNSPANLA